MVDHRLVEHYTGGFIESITPLSEWMKIKKGDTIYMRKSGLPRKVIEAERGFVVLRKVKKSSYKSQFTTYVPIDRHNFRV